MSDNKKIRRPLDNQQIDIHDPAEVRNWCESFGIEAEILKLARKEVDSVWAVDIYDWLEKNRYID